MQDNFSLQRVRPFRQNVQPMPKRPKGEISSRISARSQASARAVEAGKSFEEVIEGHLSTAASNRLVDQWKHNEPHFVRAGFKRFVPAEAGIADYSGVLFGGIAFGLEVKSTAGDRFAKASVSESQQTHLDALARAGALALLALQFRNDRAGAVDNFLVPWQAAPWEIARTAESLTRGALSAWRLEEPYMLTRFVRRCSMCRMVWPRYSSSARCCFHRKDVTP